MADFLASIDVRKLLKTPRALLVETVDLGELRRSLELSQGAFCRRYGFSLPSLRNWEQRLSRPDAAARAYLAVIARDPGRVAQLYAAAAAAALAQFVPAGAKAARRARRSPPRSRARASARQASPAAR